MKNIIYERRVKILNFIRCNLQKNTNTFSEIVKNTGLKPKEIYRDIVVLIERGGIKKDDNIFVYIPGFNYAILDRINFSHKFYW